MNRLLHIAYRLLTVVAGACIAAQAVAADIDVRVDRNPVGLNESFMIKYSTKGNVETDPDFSVLEPYIEILNQSRSSSVNIINGHYSASTSWLLNAMPKRHGELELPPVPFGNDLSPTLTLRVTEPSGRTDEQSPFFTRMRVNTQQLYAQQQLVVTQQLFSAYNISAHEFRDISYSGMEVVSEPLGEVTRYTTRVGQRSYAVVERQFAVFPQQSGALTIEPAVVGARQSTVGGLAYDPFAGNNRVMSARSKAITIEVLPIPASANMNPWLPATELELVEQWPNDPPGFVEGEPVTRTLSLKAEGLSSAQLPEIPLDSVNGLNAYPDQPMLNDVTNDTGITGYRVQKVAFIATRPGRITLPAIEIPWWDIKTQTRRVARVPARVIEVKAVQPAVEERAPLPQPGVAQQDEESSATEDQGLSLPMSPLISDTALWPLLTVFMTIGWLLTIMAWIYHSRNRKPSRSSPARPRPSIAKQQSLLAAACKRKDAAACRRELLAWGKLLFPQHDIGALRDLLPWVPARLADEIRKIDAVLYGQANTTIDFALIRRHTRELMKQVGKTSAPAPDVLEPMYR